jgi:hypothetical protein
MGTADRHPEIWASPWWPSFFAPSRISSSVNACSSVRFEHRENCLLRVFDQLFEMALNDFGCCPREAWGLSSSLRDGDAGLSCRRRWMHERIPSALMDVAQASKFDMNPVGCTKVNGTPLARIAALPRSCHAPIARPYSTSIDESLTRCFTPEALAAFAAASSRAGI